MLFFYCSKMLFCYSCFYSSDFICLEVCSNYLILANKELFSSCNFFVFCWYSDTNCYSYDLFDFDCDRLFVKSALVVLSFYNYYYTFDSFYVNDLFFCSVVFKRFNSFCFYSYSFYNSSILRGNTYIFEILNESWLISSDFFWDSVLNLET